MNLIQQALSGNLYPDYLVTINDSNGKVSLTSLINDPLGLSGAPNWGDNKILPEKIGNTISGASAVVANLANATGVSSASGLKSIDTRIKWTGSDNQSFDLSLVFAFNQGDYGVLSSIKEVNRLVHPESNVGGFYTAPLGYTGGDDNNGMLQVTIGSWFRASKLICTNSSFTIENIFDTSGKPILANINLSFKSYQLLTADEFNSWFL